MPSIKRKSIVKSPKAAKQRKLKENASTESEANSSLNNMVPLTMSDSVKSTLKNVDALANKLLPKAGNITSIADLNIPHAREVSLMHSDTVTMEIERIIVNTALSIIKHGDFRFAVPTRSASNQIYVPELDRIVLADKVSQRHFANTATARKAAISTRVLQLVHQVLAKNIHVTKRDLFYTDVKLFKEQGESDNILDDIACMVGCTRSSLNVVASEKGVVVGRITFRDDGDLIDCTRMGVGGKAIPPYIDRITDLQSDAKFILLVEKDAAFMRLAEDRFYNKFPCIILTAKGQPDVATRMFLKKIASTLKLPVLGLVDSDPYGIFCIFTTY